MSTIQRNLVYQAITRASASLDYNIHKGLQKQYEFIQQTILADNSLTEDEKTEAIRLVNNYLDRDKIFYNKGTRRICENCQKECLATLYCEYCVRNYLIANFSNWTSGNNDIDDLIQQCQKEALCPDMIVEWIPYYNLENIEYITKGGFSEIYTAGWIGGCYEEWDSKKRQLERSKASPGEQNFVAAVILKKLENIESASQSWFEEAKSHITISSKHPRIVKCYGITQNPSNGSYMLVMSRMDVNLRQYLQQNHNQLTWKERIKIAFEIIDALRWIHEEKSIHRDLHSGNILYNQYQNYWRISDLGFCGPVNKSPRSIYGNLPYIAPEVIAGGKYTFASDVYSFAMLMWEISSGKPPFGNYEHDYYLAMNIINGIRPRTVSGTPLEYKNLMKQCWDADPLKRPDINTLKYKISGINALYQNVSDELDVNDNLETSNIETNYTSSKLFTSKVHQFENFPEPRNATEEEQKAFHSKSYEFSIPDNIDDFNNSNKQENYISKSKTISILKDTSKKLSRVFKNLKIKSKNDIKNDYKGETTQHHNKKQNIEIDDKDDKDDEIYNNPNLHPENDEFEIPDDGF
ncbi:kinase-like domain-containing protein [Rhizophagus clarus]|uniref:Kinase-like domain-containing protein n=1 Tax=Rhizophagus clarus TaxID=94130 RepID=A0A8H3LTX8_9GLOM|nr:kinase-like domain-containing protein [Rhizophagus clarus]